MQVQNQPLAAATGQNQSSQINKTSAQEGSQTKAVNPDPSKTSVKATDQTPVYVKVLSRIENMLSMGEVPKIAVEGFNRAVKNRTEELSDQEKNAILKLPEAKVMGLKKIEDLPDKIAEGMKDEKSSKKLFNLLKQSSFVKMMSNQGNAPVYSPQNKTAANTSAPESTPPPASSKNAVASYQTATPPKETLSKAA